MLSILSCEKPVKPPIAKLDETKILTISDIYKKFTSNDTVFTEDYYVYGTITMDDLQGNIYKEAYLQDNTHGINLYRLKTAGALEAGLKVRINLKNVVIKNYRGKLELDFIYCKNPISQVVINTEAQKTPITPLEISIDDFFALNNQERDNYRCKLIKIKEVQFSATDTSFSYATTNNTSMTNRQLENCSGQKSMIVRTSDQSVFASKKLPAGKGSIVGIITAFESGFGTNSTITWQLLISDINMVNMTEERCQN